MFDPLLLGPKALGGPVAVQLWRRDSLGALERIAFGNEPVHSRALDAWLSLDGIDLAISDDRAGARRWLTVKSASALRAKTLSAACVNWNRSSARRPEADSFSG